MRWTIFIAVPETNIYPNVTVLHNKIYTFGEKHEIYIKYSRVNSYIKSRDELAYVETNACTFRMGENEYVVILKHSRIPFVLLAR